MAGLQEGSQIEARFGDGTDWYAGVIRSASQDGTFSIVYDDGDREEGVPRSRVRLPKLFPSVVAPFSRLFHVGTGVEAQFGGGVDWFPGQVVAVYSEGREYDILYDDGDQEQNVPPHSVRAIEQVATPLRSPQFAVGSKVEARFGGGADWFPGTVAGFNARHGTYSVAYDDGDREEGVGESLLKRPLAPQQQPQQQPQKQQPQQQQQPQQPQQQPQKQQQQQQQQSQQPQQQPQQRIQGGGEAPSAQTPPPAQAARPPLRRAPSMSSVPTAVAGPPLATRRQSSFSSSSSSSSSSASTAVAGSTVATRRQSSFSSSSSPSGKGAAHVMRAASVFGISLRKVRAKAAAPSPPSSPLSNPTTTAPAPSSFSASAANAPKASPRNLVPYTTQRAPPQQLQPQPQPSGSAMLSVGTFVFARYGGGADWFPGTVASVAASLSSYEANSYGIGYSDGDKESGVAPELVRRGCQMGSAVEGRFGGGDAWFPGTVFAVDHTSGACSIAYEDGDQETEVDGSPHANLVRLLLDQGRNKQQQPRRSSSSVASAAASSSQNGSQNRSLDQKKKERSYNVPDELKAFFPPDEVSSMVNLFELYDTDGSGAVDQDELRSILVRLGDACPSEEKLAALLAEADGDGDNEIDFQEFCLIVHRSKQQSEGPGGVGFSGVLEAVDKQLNPTGVFREYAIPSVERLVAAVADLQAFAADPKRLASGPESKFPRGCFDPLDELLRLVPLCWQRTERLVSLGQSYRAPSDVSPKCCRQRVLALTENAVALAQTKLTRDRPSSNHARALAEVLGSLRWLSVDFRVTAADAARGHTSYTESLAERYADSVHMHLKNQTLPATPTSSSSPSSSSSSSPSSSSSLPSDKLSMHIASQGAFRLPGMGASGMSERPGLRRSSGSFFGQTGQQVAEAEAGPSGSRAAANFLKGVKEGLVFFNSKVRSPIVLDCNTEEGQVDLLSRNFCDALTNLLHGLCEYVEAHHPDGLMWKWQKSVGVSEALSPMTSFDDSDALTGASSPRSSSGSAALSKFKAAGLAVKAANRFGVALREAPDLKPAWATGEEPLPLSPGVKRLGGMLFRQVLPDEICTDLENEAERELKAMAWPITEAEQGAERGARRKGLGGKMVTGGGGSGLGGVGGLGREDLGKGKASGGGDSGAGSAALLSKVSFWDTKMVEASKRKDEEAKAVEYIVRNKAKPSSPSKTLPDALNSSPTSFYTSGLSRSRSSSLSPRSPYSSSMDMTTAHMIITASCNDPKLMREAAEVIKKERLEVIIQIDGGVANASGVRASEEEKQNSAKITWGGMVTHNEFEAVTSEHNFKVQAQLAEAIKLKKVGQATNFKLPPGYGGGSGCGSPLGGCGIYGCGGNGGYCGNGGNGDGSEGGGGSVGGYNGGGYNGGGYSGGGRGSGVGGRCSGSGGSGSVDEPLSGRGFVAWPAVQEGEDGVFLDGDDDELQPSHQRRQERAPVPPVEERSAPLPGTLRRRPSYAMHDRMTSQQEKFDPADQEQDSYQEEAAFGQGQDQGRDQNLQEAFEGEQQQQLHSQPAPVAERKGGNGDSLGGGGAKKRQHKQRKQQQEEQPPPSLPLFHQGQRIESNYGGAGRWFLGRVVGVFQEESAESAPNFAYDVLFDDGESEQGAQEALLRAAPEIQVWEGAAVKGRYGGGLELFPATVSAVHYQGGDDNELFCDLAYEDGDAERGVGLSMLFPAAAGT